jgi:hypothetical protein
MRTRRTAESATTNTETEEKTKMDFTKATKADVPEIVEMILALRKVTLETGTITNRTQSLILRTIPPAVLIDVALGLEKPIGLAAVLSGEAKAR